MTAMAAALTDVRIYPIMTTKPDLWHLGRDFDVIDATGRLGHGQAVFAQAFNMDLDCLTDPALRRLERRPRCHAAGEIGNVGRIVRLRFRNSGKP